MRRVPSGGTAAVPHPSSSCALHQRHIQETGVRPAGGPADRAEQTDRRGCSTHGMKTTGSDLPDVVDRLCVEIVCRQMSL